jgi:hypothetical protein
VPPITNPYVTYVDRHALLAETLKGDTRRAGKGPRYAFVGKNAALRRFVNPGPADQPLALGEPTHALTRGRFMATGAAESAKTDP